MHPHARKNELFWMPLGAEMVVYDPDTHVAHYLDRTATLVWINSDGQRSVTEISEFLTAEINQVVSQETVLATLQVLSDANLMTGHHSLQESGPDRRDFVRLAASIVTGTSLLAAATACADLAGPESGETGATGGRVYTIDSPTPEMSGSYVFCTAKSVCVV
jgi:hypothetical protein